MLAKLSVQTLMGQWMPRSASKDLKRSDAADELKVRWVVYILVKALGNDLKSSRNNDTEFILDEEHHSH